jgi:tripartite-type tricarboxylate transporter receptor subunit TctC
MRHISYVAGVIAAFTLVAVDTAFAADNYPDKPLRVIVAYAPGGGADIVGRLMCQKLSERTGQQFVVINTPGASGSIGANTVAHSTPDGYTLYFGQTAEMSILPNIMSGLHYDPVKDFTPIVQVSSYPYVIAVNPKLPIHSLKEFIAYAKAHPGELNYGTPGIGSSAQLAVELFAREVGIKLTHVPFKGSGPAVLAAISGVIQVVFGDAASTTPQVVSGQLRALAVTATKRSPKLPDVPTVAEAGVPNYTVAAWHGFFGPAGVSPEVIEKVNSEVNVILHDSATRDRLAQDGIEAVGGTPEAFGTLLKRELGVWGKVSKDAGIKIN